MTMTEAPPKPISYSCLLDKEIGNRQEVARKNVAKLIADHNNLPFWKRWLEEECLKIKIMYEWRSFETWRMKRIKECPE